MKWFPTITSIATIALASLGCTAQEAAKPKDKAPRATAQKSSVAKGKHYSLPATKENVQWGWLDPTEKPRLTINSGDTVSIETLYHAMDAIKPSAVDHTLSGPDMDELARLRKANPGGGPHSLTGPIYIEGAEPGDTLEVRILKIVPKEYGQNFNLPGKDFSTGLLPKEFPEGFVRYYKFDLAKMQTEFKPGIMVKLKPFPGIIAVAPDPDEPKEKAGPPIKDAKGRTSSLRPWKKWIQYGPERTAGRHYLISAGFRERRAALDGRLTLRAGQWGDEPGGVGMRL
jgi:hypothetical protein